MLVDVVDDALPRSQGEAASVDYPRSWRGAVLPQQMYRQCRTKAFCVQATADAALAQFLPTEQSDAVDHHVPHADRGLELEVADLAEFRLPDLLNECLVHRDGEEGCRSLATNPERQPSIAHMSLIACDLTRAQTITVGRAPIHTEHLALMDRHRYLRGADTEALDWATATTNECNTTQREPVFEYESSDRRRRSEIDRELVLALRGLDRSHGRPFAWHGIPLQRIRTERLLVQCTLDFNANDTLRASPSALSCRTVIEPFTIFGIS